MAKNQAVTAATQIGMVNGTDEGFATINAILGIGAATMLPAADPTAGGASAATQVVLNNLYAQIQAVIAADADKIADSFASGDNSVVNTGTADGPILSIVPAVVAALLAANPAAMQTLAAALLSADAGNSVTLGSDGLIFENDAI